MFKYQTQAAEVEILAHQINIIEVDFWIKGLANIKSKMYINHT